MKKSFGWRNLQRPGIALVVCVLVLGHFSFALTNVTPNPLETAPTHWDQGGVWRGDGNAVIDQRDGRIQSVSQLFEGPYSGTPEAAARQFLAAHQDWVGLDANEKNLRQVKADETPGGFSVTFQRFVGDVPVYPGDLVVSFDKDMYARFYFSSLYLFTEDVSTFPGLLSSDAEQTVIRYLQPKDDKPLYGPVTDLVVWAGDNRDFALGWRVRTEYQHPAGDWEVIVEANTGRIRRVKDLSVAVDGTGYVFDPDPISTAGQSYGSPGLTDNNDADSPQLTAQRFNRTLHDISSVTVWGITYYRLSGPYCEIQDISAPNIAPVVQANNSAFNYTRSQDAFEDVVVYYQIDKSQRWIQSLGFYNIQNGPIGADPHAEDYACNAHYHSIVNNLTFGQGPGTDDADAAEDADVILHEYGHAINWAITPSWGGGDEERLGEGWGDYWAGSNARSLSSFQANHFCKWALHDCFGGRSLQAGLHYPEDNTGVHYGGQIWSQALYDAELSINNRQITNRVALQSYYYYGSGASMVTAANAVLTADEYLFGGEHVAAYTTSFVARGLIGAPNNDQCPGYYIFTLPYSDNGSTATAANDYMNCVGYASQDVVYTLISDQCARHVTVSLCGSNYDTGLGIRTGGACPGNTEVACNDDHCGFQSEATFVAQPNAVYYIIVHGYGTSSGNYVITVTGSPSDPAPPNDACPGATQIETLPYNNSGSTCGAASNYATCVASASPEVVYQYTSPLCQSVTVSLCGSGYNTAIEVRSEGACPGSQLVACNDDYCGQQSQTTFNAAASQTYYLLVHGYCTLCRGPYTINVTSNGPIVAPNDTCPGTLVTSVPYLDYGNTGCASNDFANCIGETSNDVVYHYTPMLCQTVTASLCGSGYDTAIEVRAGGECPGLMQVACNDDDCGFQSIVTHIAQAGVTYYYMIHGYANDSGPYTFMMTQTPGAIAPNDLCAGAYAITTLPYMDVGNTNCANNDRFNCDGWFSPEVFYSLQLPWSSDVTVSLCGSQYDTGLEIRTGGDTCPGDTLVVCNDDSLCDGVLVPQSMAGFHANAGQRYWIILHGYVSEAGVYLMNVTGTVRPPDSLVARRYSTSIHLEWTASGPAGDMTYRVYRANTPDVPTTPDYLWATTTNTFYTDPYVIDSPQPMHFYTVTAENAAPSREESGSEARRGEAAKVVSAEMVAKMKSVELPAPYLDPAWIESPTPNRQMENQSNQNQHGNWLGTLAPLPAARQTKQ